MIDRRRGEVRAKGTFGSKGMEIRDEGEERTRGGVTTDEGGSGQRRSGVGIPPERLRGLPEEILLLNGGFSTAQETTL